MKSKSKVITRMAPSPTGNLHIGGVRTALFNLLYARQHGGKFILRIEDTDKERSKKEYEENILESFSWLGLEYDELYRQSERGEIYKKYLQNLIDNQSAYISQEETGDNKEVIRFKNPNKKIKFTDIIRGEVEFDTTDLGDFVIAKSLEEPLYHLAVVVDDGEMGVTQVIRGEEHLSNTPRQILILEALGFERPEYAHIPLILAPDRSKLSKRAGAVSALEYRDSGYLPEAILNYLALLGWNPGTDEEILSLNELIGKFDLTKVQKGGAIFSTEKLRWINKEWMKKNLDQTLQEINKKIQEKYQVGDVHPELSTAIFERVETLGEAGELLEAGEWEYFFSQPDLDVEKIAWKKSSREIAKKHLEKLTELVGNDSEVMSYAEGEGKGDVLWPLRYALSGRDKSPDPFTLMHVLGPAESVERIKQAIELLK